MPGNTGERRSDVDIARLKKQMFKMLMEGLDRDEIMKQLNIPQRTYYYYYKDLQNDIIAEQQTQQKEDVLFYKKVAEEQLNDIKRELHKLGRNEKITPRTRMDSLYREGEIVSFIFKLHVETGQWLQEYRKIDYNALSKIPISPAEDESEQLGERIDGERS